MSNRRLAALSTGFLLAWAIGCTQSQQPNDPGDGSQATSTEEAAGPEMAVPEMPPSSSGPELVVPLMAKSDSQIEGNVHLTETTEGVRIKVTVNNAEPGLHGLHVHQTADCSAPDGKSAGGHFNPADNPHGLPEQEKRHMGDLGNITIEEGSRSGALEATVRFADLSEDGEYTLRGRAVILHADPDTGEQPTGGSGARIGCAEITDEAASVAKKTASTGQ